MCPTIHISSRVYEGLKGLAEPFETPTGVIQRLLDVHYGNSEGGGSPKTTPIPMPEGRPILSFTPSDEDVFKAMLIDRKQAQVVLHLSDGSTESVTWIAERFSTNSNLRANIWSGYLRGWKEKGIVKAEFTID